MRPDRMPQSGGYVELSQYWRPDWVDSYFIRADERTLFMKIDPILKPKPRKKKK